MFGWRLEVAGGRDVAGDWLNLNGSMMCPARHSPPCFSLCLACPERPLWSGDGLEASDTVSGRAGQKEALADRAGNVFFSVCPKSLWKMFWKTDWRCS
jgi:hypothetical protein